MTGAAHDLAGQRPLRPDRGRCLASVIWLMALNRLLHAHGAPRTAGDVGQAVPAGKLTSDTFRYLGQCRRSEVEAGLVLAGCQLGRRSPTAARRPRRCPAVDGTGRRRHAGLAGAAAGEREALLAAELCAAVYAACGGNPLYLAELLRAAEFSGPAAGRAEASAGSRLSDAQPYLVTAGVIVTWHLGLPAPGRSARRHSASGCQPAEQTRGSTGLPAHHADLNPGYGTWPISRRLPNVPPSAGCSRRASSGSRPSGPGARRRRIIPLRRPGRSVRRYVADSIGLRRFRGKRQAGPCRIRSPASSSRRATARSSPSTGPKRRSARW